MQTRYFDASDGHRVCCYHWPAPDRARAVIHIAHGMGEHAARYDWAASRIAAAGYAVFANDHRGHGNTAAELGRFGADGWNRIIADLHELMKSHRTDFPDRSLVLLGHSMGSMLAEQYIELRGDTLDAVILSGSPGFSGGLTAWLLRTIARFERWRLGPEGDSALLESLVFGSANKAFAAGVDAPTGFEWLSRDAAQVAAYVADPACGFVPCAGALFDLFKGAAWTQRADSVGQIPQRLPVLVFSGTADPVHGSMRNIDRMLAAYRAHGLAVDTRFYPDGRHEMLNETNREEVLADVIAWLDRHT